MKNKTIHQIVIVDDGVEANISDKNASIKEYFSGHKHIVWNKQALIELMKDNQDEDVLWAFNKLKPYSFKADLAKYYVVYRFGGWYSDINNTFIANPPNIDNNDFVVFSERLELTGTTWSTQTSIFYADKGHYILKQAIEDIIDNCKKEFYGKHALCPTGPNLLGSAIAKFNLPEDSNYLIGKFCDDDNGTKFRINGYDLARYKQNKLSAGDPGIPGGNSYVDMWKNRNIYE
jgi:mannosyltransferase OCH1-like enzyme